MPSFFFAAIAAYNFQIQGNGIIGLGFGALAIYAFFAGAGADRVTEQDIYRKRIKDVCSAMTKDEPFKRLRAKFNAYRLQFDLNPHENNEAQGFVDVDLDA